MRPRISILATLVALLVLVLSVELDDSKLEVSNNFSSIEEYIESLLVALEGRFISIISRLNIGIERGKA